MAVSWRLECWSNPRVGTSVFVTEIPFTRATLTDRDDSIATSSVEIPAYEATVIDAIIRIDPITRTASTANVVRAFYVPESGPDPTLPALEFWATDIDYIIAEDATVTAKVFGPHIKGGVDEARILPFDYPANPPAEEDWRYGGTPVTADGWFEATSSTSMVVEVTIADTVTGGTWTYSTPGGTTAPLDWNDDPVEVDSQITLLPDVAAVDVTRSGDGTSGSPFVFRITHRDPVTYGTNPTANGASLTGGGLTLVVTQQGGLDPSPWTPSTNMVTGERFGSYAGDDGSNNFGGFYIDDLDPFEGDYCLFVNGLSQFAGNQRVYTGLTPGARYRFDAYCKPTNPGVEPYRLTAKDVDESYFVFGRDIIAAAGWNLHDSIEWIQPDQRTTAVIRFAYTGTGNPDPYRFEGALYEGAPSATVGTIVADLLADLKTDHSPRTRLGWLDLDTTVSATVDSSGSTWSGPVSVNLRAWDRLGSDILAGDLARLGVEWNVEPTSLTAWELKVWDAGNRGTDRTSGADPAFTVGAVGFAGGRSAARRQQFTVGIGRAPDGTFVEVDDSDGITAFGSIDGLIEADALTPDSITSAVNQALAEVQANAYSLQTSSGPGGPVPFVDVFIGDTVNFYIPALDAIHARRLHSLTVTVEADTWSATVVGSRTYTGMSAVAEQIRRLSNPRRRRPGDPDALIGSLAPPMAGGGGSIPWLVAASDSPVEWQGIAGSVATAGSAESAINAALATYDEVWLAPGTYTVSNTDDTVATGSVEIGNGQRIIGMGPAFRSDSNTGPTAWITTQATNDPTARVITHGGDLSEIANVRIAGTSGVNDGPGTAIRSTGGGLRLNGCAVYGTRYGVRADNQLRLYLDSTDVAITLDGISSSVPVQFNTTGAGSTLWMRDARATVPLSNSTAVTGVIANVIMLGESLISGDLRGLHSTGTTFTSFYGDGGKWRIVGDIAIEAAGPNTTFSRPVFYARAGEIRGRIILSHLGNDGGSDRGQAGTIESCSIEHNLTTTGDLITLTNVWTFLISNNDIGVEGPNTVNTDDLISLVGSGRVRIVSNRSADNGGGTWRYLVDIDATSADNTVILNDWSDAGGGTGIINDLGTGTRTSIPAGSAGSLGDLADVDTTGATLGDALVYDGTEWVAQPTAGGGLSLDDLLDVAAPAPVTGDVLTFDGTDWIAAVPGAGSSGQLVVPFHNDATANVTLTNQAVAAQFLANSNRNITRADLALYTECRLTVRVITGSASVNSPRLRLRYRTAFSTVVTDYLRIGTSDVDASLTATGLIATAWIPLEVAARADVFLIVDQIGGDAAADPAVGIVTAQFR